MYMRYIYMYIQAAKKRLKGGKVVHLRVLVKNLVPAGNNASAVLKDPTGCYHGYIRCHSYTYVLP